MCMDPWACCAYQGLNGHREDRSGQNCNCSPPCLSTEVKYAFQYCHLTLGQLYKLLKAGPITLPQKKKILMNTKYPVLSYFFQDIHMMNCNLVEMLKLTVLRMGFGEKKSITHTALFIFVVFLSRSQQILPKNLFCAISWLSKNCSQGLTVWIV